MVLDLYYDGVNINRKYFVEKTVNCNGEMLVIEVSNAGFWGRYQLISQSEKSMVIRNKMVYNLSIIARFGIGNC